MIQLLKSNYFGAVVLASGTFLGTLTLVNCSSKSSSSDSVAPTLSEFSYILGEDMVVSSPTAQRTTATSLSLDDKGLQFYMKNGVLIMAAPTAEASPTDKKEGLETLLSAAAATTCSVDITLANSAKADCYGPSVNYTNHDADNSSGQWPSGDLGIWEEAGSSGQACIADQLNMQMKGAASLVDLGQYITAGLGCIAKKNSLSLPAVGASLDLAEKAEGLIKVDATDMTVTTATLSREANDADGNSVYVTTLSGTAGAKTFSIRLKHVPTASDDSTNKGKVSVKLVEGSTTKAASLEYEKTSATVGKMLLKKVDYNSAPVDPYFSSSDLTVDFSKSWNGNANYLLAEFDPSSYVGTFAYAWQAGNADSHTRVFNAKISASGSDVTGSAFFGFGPKMQEGPGSISGMICAWTGPDVSGSKTVQSKVQRQDMTLSSGKFVLSGTSKTVFDPVVSCEASTLQMSWGTSSTRNASATTENLAPLTELSTAIGTLPTAPDNVD